MKIKMTSQMQCLHHHHDKHKENENDTYGWSCAPLVGSKKVCWSDRECEEISAPDHKDEEDEGDSDLDEGAD